MLAAAAFADEAAGLKQATGSCPMICDTCTEMVTKSAVIR
jgi:hypothetical protein